MQWHTRCESELDIETKLFETKEVFSNVLGEVTAHELLAAIIEGTSTVSASVVHSWPQKFRVV
jgi:nucleoside permease NupC